MGDSAAPTQGPAAGRAQRCPPSSSSEASGVTQRTPRTPSSPRTPARRPVPPAAAMKSDGLATDSKPGEAACAPHHQAQTRGSQDQGRPHGLALAQRDQAGRR
ncbi:hypothetical protein CRUP_006849 [Coryphaenoides rupestris]|nr:hypothetical protein CRUP_006849 [Coryphaenoides rupestris]